MKNSTLKLVGLKILISGFLLLISTQFKSCKPDDPEEEWECDTCFFVLKPNIYLYPIEITKIRVNLSFPIGGKITASIPTYGSGWNVTVDTTGIINNNYEYLFYESVQPNVWQLSEGWTIKKSDLKDFFSYNMLNYGFNEKEIKDFLDFWIPKLIDFEYYVIYPQESNIIEKAIKLDFSLIPDDVLRLFYLIKGINGEPHNMIKVPNPNTQLNRTGFHVTEWGVILK
jgi:hypothetical protein